MNLKTFLLYFTLGLTISAQGQLFSGIPNPGDTRLGIGPTIGIFRGTGIVPGISARGFYRPGTEKIDLIWTANFFPRKKFTQEYQYSTPNIKVKYNRESLGLFTGTNLNIYVVGDKVSPKNAYITAGIGWGLWASLTKEDTTTFLSSPFSNDGLVQDFPIILGTGTNYALSNTLHVFGELQFWAMPLSWLARYQNQAVLQDAVGIPNSFQIQVGIRLIAEE